MMAKRTGVKLVKPPQTTPIKIGAFTFTTTGMEVSGRPSFGEYQGAGDFVKRAHQASGFWLADWLRYGEERDDWKEKLSHAQDVTGLSEKTLKNIRAIGGIDPSRRRDDVDFGLHDAVTGLPPNEQTNWLRRAAEEGLSVRQLRLEIRHARRPRIIEGQAILTGKFRLIMADPPWLYGDRPPSGVGAQQHYPGMTIKELCDLPIAAHTMKDAALAMWVTAPLALANPGPRDVGEAWGFEYKQQIIWDKVDHNYSHYTGGQHEILTLWTRGSCSPDIAQDLPDSIQTFRKSRQHSEKPDEFRRLLERLWNHGPRLELFGRKPVDGWTVFGNDARLWATEAKG